jgi:hypothetical protein
LVAVLAQPLVVLAVAVTVISPVARQADRIQTSVGPGLGMLLVVVAALERLVATVRAELAETAGRVGRLISVIRLCRVFLRSVG